LFESDNSASSKNNTAVSDARPRAHLRFLSYDKKIKSTPKTILAVYSSRSRALKPRCNKKWEQIMRSDFDAPPIGHAIADGWTEFAERVLPAVHDAGKADAHVAFHFGANVRT
jgi:hypothetical protein